LLCRGVKLGLSHTEEETFEKRMLRKIFGSKREEVRRKNKKLHNEELYDPYSSTNTHRAIKSIIMRCVGHVARMGDRIIAYRVLVGRSEEKMPLGRPKSRW
jgi:hypothetical protein